MRPCGRVASATHLLCAISAMAGWRWAGPLSTQRAVSLVPGRPQNQTPREGSARREENWSLCRRFQRGFSKKEKNTEFRIHVTLCWKHNKKKPLTFQYLMVFYTLLLHLCSFSKKVLLEEAEEKGGNSGSKVGGK